MSGKITRTDLAPISNVFARDMDVNQWDLCNHKLNNKIYI